MSCSQITALTTTNFTLEVLLKDAFRCALNRLSICSGLELMPASPTGNRLFLIRNLSVVRNFIYPLAKKDQKLSHGYPSSEVLKIQKIFWKCISRHLPKLNYYISCTYSTLWFHVCFKVAAKANHGVLIRPLWIDLPSCNFAHVWYPYTVSDCLGWSYTASISL